MILLSGELPALNKAIVISIGIPGRVREDRICRPTLAELYSKIGIATSNLGLVVS